MRDINIAIVGLGYVGLELAMALSEHFQVTGYDHNKQRIIELSHCQDTNSQFNKKKLTHTKLIFSSDIKTIQPANVYIITVPTPVYYYEFPDLELLKDATQQIASVLKKGDLVIYESSVYPGTTTSICIPILEEISKLKEQFDFDVGYSPERICPSDSEHSIKKVTKLISASNATVMEKMEYIYSKICENVYPVSKIEHAEAAKILENVQRDVNIALINEFSKIMHMMNLDTHQILTAAETKFNFIPIKPGLVGGHCISVDPMYLAFQAKRVAVYPELILCARKVNDSMTQFLLQEMLKMLAKYATHPAPYKIGIFGVTYKDNIPDIRNSLVFKFIKECEDYPFGFMIHDPYFNQNIHKPNKIITISSFDEISNLDVALICVSHHFYKTQGLETFIKKCKTPTIIMDIPNMFVDEHAKQDINYWHL
jgi:UDP-N-acetyl-D-galactosamine dehydrogenase